jgi:hypothetical protein
MRIWLLGGFAIAGCGFQAVAQPGLDIDGGAGAGSGATGSRTCDVPAGVRDQVKLCMTFEPTPMVQDLSGLGHVLSENASVRVAPTTRDAGAAASLASGAGIQIDDAADLDLAQVTVDMWIRPEGTPPAFGYRLLERFGQYSAWYLGRGVVRCGLGAGRSFDGVDSSPAFSDAEWHHVACVVSGRHLRVYVDGNLTGCRSFNGKAPSGVRAKTAIGASQPPGPFTAHYQGGLDDVHIFGRSLTAAEVCGLAGRTNCTPTAPCSGGPDDDLAAPAAARGRENRTADLQLDPESRAVR